MGGARDSGKCNKDANGNSVDIVKNPEKVVNDDTLAWCTAAYFWKKSVQDDRCPCDMGNTIDAINPMECNNKKHEEEAQRRFCYYKAFYESYASTTLWKGDVDKNCIDNLDKKCSCPER